MRAPLLFSATALALLAACSNGEPPRTPATATGPDATQPMNDPARQADGTPATASQTSTTALSEADSEALGILSAINQNEIAAGKQAQGRKLPPRVAAYADMMVKDHTDNDAQIQKIGTPAESALASAQKTKGEAELAALGEHKDDYAKAYIDAMVSGHTEALRTIDEKLLPQAQSSEAKAHLQKTRSAVSQHLDQAKGLQESSSAQQ